MTTSCPIEIVEPRTGWWTQASALGQRIQEPIPAVDAGLIEVGSVDPSNFPGPPRPVALNLFRSNAQLSSLPVDFVNADVRWQLIYGVGAASHKVELDAALGTQLTLVCNSLRVNLVSYAPDADVAYDNLYTSDSRLIAGYMVGLGAVSPRQPPTFTTQVRTIAGFQSHAFPLHPFARSLTLITQGTPTAANIRLTFSRNSSTEQSSMALATNELEAAARCGGIPIPGGATEVLVAHNNINDLKAGLIYQLGL